MSPFYCLALDLGNSALKWAVYHLPPFNVTPALLQPPVAQGWFDYSPPTFSQQLKEALRGLPALENLEIRACSVVPALNPAVEAVCSYYFPKVSLGWLKPQHLPGLHLGGYPVDRLGADRWANLLAAHVEYASQPVLVADFGTATTLNVLLCKQKSPDTTETQHRFAGGQILPGYQTFGNILAQKTAQLPALQACSPQKPLLLAQDTQSSIQAGLVYGYPLMVIGLIEAIQRELSDQGVVLQLVATGGQVQSLQEPLQRHFGDALRVDTELTLRGVVYSF